MANSTARSATQAKQAKPKVQGKSSTPLPLPCAQHDVMTSVSILLESLATSRRSGEETEATQAANTYLEERVLTYLAMMRKRPLEHIYEFLVPLNGQGIGWYWRHPKASPNDSRNWYGPYASRKAAIQARMAQPGALRTTTDVRDRAIFGED